MAFSAGSARGHLPDVKIHTDPALVALGRLLRRTGAVMIKERPAALLAALISWSVIATLWGAGGIADQTGKIASIVVGALLFLYALGAVIADVEASAAQRSAARAAEIEEQIARLRAFLGERAARVAFAIPGAGGAQVGEPELAALRRDLAELGMEVRALKSRLQDEEAPEPIDARLDRMKAQLDDRISECVAMAILMAEKRLESRTAPAPATAPAKRPRAKKDAD